MATDRPAHGTLLELKIVSTFTPIGARAEIGSHSPELKMRDVTGLDDPTVKKRPAITDLGTLGFTLFFDPDDTTHIALRSKVLTPPATPDEWKMIYNDGDTTPAFDDFKGFLTKCDVKVGGPLDTVMAECEIDITDLFTPTVGVP